MRNLCMSLAVLAVAVVASAKDAKAPKGDVVWPAEAIQWKDGPMKGVHMAALWGSIDKGGSYGAMVKFDGGLMHELHSHTQDLKIVVVSGTFVHKPEGGQETKLGPGSYLLQRGKQKHVSGCAAGADCVFFMTSGDKFDMIPAQAPAK